MSIIWDLITGSGIWGYVAAALTALASLAGFYLKARRDERTKQDLEDANEHIETRKRIDQSVEDSRKDGGAWHDRLRRNRDKR